MTDKNHADNIRQRSKQLEEAWQKLQASIEVARNEGLEVDAHFAVKHRTSPDGKIQGSISHDCRLGTQVEVSRPL